MPRTLKHFGFQFLRSTDGVTYAALAGLLSADPPNVARDDIDDSDLETADEARVYQPGWTEGGEVTVTLKFSNAVLTQLTDDRNAGTELFWRAQKALASGETTPARRNFKGYVKSVGEEQVTVSGSNIHVITATIKLSGRETFAPAA